MSTSTAASGEENVICSAGFAVAAASACECALADGNIATETTTASIRSARLIAFSPFGIFVLASIQFFYLRRPPPERPPPPLRPPRPPPPLKLEEPRELLARAELPLPPPNAPPPPLDESLETLRLPTRSPPPDPPLAPRSAVPADGAFPRLPP